MIVIFKCIVLDTKITCNNVTPVEGSLGTKTISLPNCCKVVCGKSTFCYTSCMKTLLLCGAQFVYC